MIAVVALVVGCGESKLDARAKAEAKAKAAARDRHVKVAAEAKGVEIADPIIEKAIRMSLGSGELGVDFAPFGGKLTKANLEKVKNLNFTGRLFHGQPHETFPGRDSLMLTEMPKGLEKLTQLETLRLGKNHLTKLPEGLEKLTQLTFLTIDYNHLTGVAVLEKLTQLEVLKLHANKLTDVKGLENLTKLTILNLSQNQLTEIPKGLEKLTKLTELSLGDNQLTDVTGLEKLTNLTWLSLDFNDDQLTKAQIDQLQKALPKCKIRSDWNPNPR